MVPAAEILLSVAVWRCQLFPFEHLARIVERRPREKDLVGARQGHHARANAHLHAVKVLWLGHAFALLDHDLADVNADAVGQGVHGALRQCSQSVLEQQRKTHRVGRLDEDDEKRVTRRADLLSFGELPKPGAHKGVGTLDERDPSRSPRAGLIRVEPRMSVNNSVTSPVRCRRRNASTGSRYWSAVSGFIVATSVAGRRGVEKG